MTQNARRNFLILMAAAILLACAPAWTPALTPIPTFDPNSINTVIAETVNAAATQTQFFVTPTLTPTLTSTPTKTPTQTPVPTNTFIFIIYSPTSAAKRADKDYACELVAQSPADGSFFGADFAFTTRWQVRNTGLLAWQITEVDYVYRSGRKMHNQAGFDLPRDIPIGETFDVVVNMSTPGKTGKYTTEWALVAGKQAFCRLDVTIIVK